MDDIAARLPLVIEFALRIIEHQAKTIQALAAYPSNRFEVLKGDRLGQHSIRINDQWRICFEWPSDEVGAVNIEIVDYH